MGGKGKELCIERKGGITHRRMRPKGRRTTTFSSGEALSAVTGIEAVRGVRGLLVKCRRNERMSQSGRTKGKNIRTGKAMAQRSRLIKEIRSKTTRVKKGIEIGSTKKKSRLHVREKRIRSRRNGSQKRFKRREIGETR